MHIILQLILYLRLCFKKNTFKIFIEKKKVEKLRKLDLNQLINFSQNGVFSDFNDSSPKSSGGLTYQIQFTEPLG